MKCAAIMPLVGQCTNEGRVELVSSDWHDEKITARFLFCFDCTKKAIESGIFSEIDLG